MKATVRMALERETKGAVRYNEVDAEGAPVDKDAAVLTNLYIRKSALQGAAPAKLTVTIEG